MKNLILVAAGLAYMHGLTTAQTLYSEGAGLHISAGAVVWVNGGLGFAAGSVFTNNGDLTVTKNSTFPFPGNFMLGGTSVAGGDGQYHVAQDWVNDAVFNAGGGTVELNGNTAQSVTSGNGTVTTFHHLVLTGNGTGPDRKKILRNVDARVDASGSLAINNRELDTETNTFYVSNPAPGSVTNNTVFGSEGFVSGATPGYFSRETDAAGTYLFPTGSSAGGAALYRPLEITPSAGSNTYKARLNTRDATADGYDRSALEEEVCATNARYYHSVVRAAGSSPADLRFHYVASADGAWNRLARWKTADTRWHDLGTVSTGTSGGFATVTRTAWNFPDTDHPYILSTVRPPAPALACPSVCEHSAGNVFTASGSGTGSTYHWTFPASATLRTGQGTASTTADWSTGTGYIYVYADNGSGCVSLPDSCLPLANLSPVAEFTVSAENGFSNSVTFTDASTWPAHWLWDFGDGAGSVSPSPVHEYNGTGGYTVTLTVTSKDGCVAQIHHPVTVEGNPLFIPNTFTPTGDHLNEGFRPVMRSGGPLSFSIFNRWGELLYASDADDAYDTWDGTYRGKNCSEDIYVCRVRYKNQTGAYRIITTHVTLLR